MVVFKHIGYFLLGALFIACIPLLMALAIVVTVGGCCLGAGMMLCGKEPKWFSTYS